MRAEPPLTAMYIGTNTLETSLALSHQVVDTHTVLGATLLIAPYPEEMRVRARIHIQEFSL